MQQNHLRAIHLANINPQKRESFSFSVLGNTIKLCIYCAMELVHVSNGNDSQMIFVQLNLMS